MNIDSVKRILVVGSGTMGQEIGLQCALHGYEVVLYDLDPIALTTAESRMAEYLVHRVKEGHFDKCGSSKRKKPLDIRVRRCQGSAECRFTQ